VLRQRSDLCIAEGFGKTRHGGSRPRAVAVGAQRGLDLRRAERVEVRDGGSLARRTVADRAGQGERVLRVRARRVTARDCDQQEGEGPHTGIVVCARVSAPCGADATLCRERLCSGRVSLHERAELFDRLNRLVESRAEHLEHVDLSGPHVECHVHTGLLGAPGDAAGIV
jgi:hypothetical protein